MHAARPTGPMTPSPRSEDTEDLAWLRASSRGDASAFACLYRRHHSRLMRFLWRHVARTELAEEIVNDTMWVVWRKASDFRGDARVGTWIVGIAYRCMLRALRDGPSAAEVNESALGDFWFDTLPHAQAEDASREASDWLRQGLKTLPQEQRLTLELAYLLGESCEGIAAIMNCPVGTVKARMFHARVRLRNVLPALGGDAPAEPEPVTGRLVG